MLEWQVADGAISWMRTTAVHHTFFFVAMIHLISSCDEVLKEPCPSLSSEPQNRAEVTKMRLKQGFPPMKDTAAPDVQRSMTILCFRFC